MNDEIVRRRLDELDDPGAAAVGLDIGLSRIDARPAKPPRALPSRRRRSR
jgi:hypothetical protein